MWTLVYVGYERACVLQSKQDVFGYIRSLHCESASTATYVCIPA